MNESKRKVPVGLYLAEKRILRYLLDHEDVQDYPIFYSPYARAIATALESLRKSGKEVTVASLTQEASLIDPSVTQEMILEIMEFPETKYEDLERQLEILSSYTIKSAILEILWEMEEILKEERPFSPSDLSTGLSRLHELTSEVSSQSLKSIDEMYSAYTESLQSRMTSISGPTVGDALLDSSLTMKARGGQIILFAGSTGTGKTIFAINLIYHRILACQPTIWCSLEMTAEACMDRFLARSLNIPVSQFYDPSYIPYILPKLTEDKTRFQKAPFGFVDASSVSILDLEKIVTSFRSKYQIPLSETVGVFVDLVTQVKDFLTSPNRNISTAFLYEASINEMNRLAKSLNVCWFLFAQMGRETEKIQFRSLNDLEKARPSLVTIKNSNALAERSRVVLGLFRPKYLASRYLPHLPGVETIPDILEVQILKQSMGGTGDILRYKFEPEFSRVTPLTGDGYLSDGAEPEIGLGGILDMDDSSRKKEKTSGDRKATGNSWVDPADWSPDMIF